MFFCVGFFRMKREFSFRQVCACLLLGVVGLLVLPPHAGAQSAAASDVQEVDARLDKIQKSVSNIQDRLQNHLDAVDDAELVSMRDALQQSQAAADDMAAKLEPELAGVQARLKELGTPAADAPEPPDIAQQRAQLTKRQTLLDAQLKLARLTGVEARQGQDQVSLQRRVRFRAELGKRSQSLFSADFRKDLLRDLPRDLRRLGTLGDELKEGMRAVPARGWGLAVVLALGVLAIGAVLMRGLGAFTVRHTAPTRLRRSIFGVLTVVLYTLTPGLLASILLFTLHWDGKLGAGMDAFLTQCVIAIYVAGFVAGLGTVLLSPNRSSWRLPAISDRLARKLARVPAAFAVVMSLAWMAERLLELVNATLSTTLLVNGLMTVALNILIGFTVWKMRSSVRKQAQQVADDALAASPVSAWARTTPSVLVLVIAVSLLAFLSGFIALSSLIAQEIIWLAMVGSTAYLLVVLVTDIFDSLVARVRAEREAGALNDSQAYARSQLLVLVSGMLRLLLITLGVALVLLPFGEDPSEWLQRRLGFITSGFKVGEVLIRPTSILLTMGVLLIGIYAVRVLRSWVKDQLLPVTRLDESMRMSTANLLSYLAYFAVFMIALSSLGLGLERMAWIVSALSVGIGFGLQAVVQNFVSGVILVAERPIKVGDWVSLDGVEGNVRKINARATEIELFDRSTMIVPNSEFITKKVRNVTMASPLGVVTVKFNLPVDTDAAAVRDMMMASMEAQSEVLEKPAPSVTLDGFTATSLVFSASCFVNSPRSAARMRSEITFDILARLREAGLALSSTQQVTILQQPAPHSSASPGAAPAEDGPAPFGTSA